MAIVLLLLLHTQNAYRKKLNYLRPKLITYLQLLIKVNPMSMSIHTSIVYLCPYIISHDVDTLLAHSNTNLNWNCDDGWVKIDYDWFLISVSCGVRDRTKE
jgi:hypothetical protein